ncbi:efflux RND transporter periplasmic adaptor subunit [Microvirga sp. VF16]|uniref:efflux RND transporter periplasmic adaptor subunit n=1 Tax=Microvirga sp. VF16 TaxID=2807101 RepID=UPI00193D5990|nr:efflux RND transporter periplasmic adaptor subunit [Microvirga sp. VF16]QRM31427.1 efflux RND transporter periplasmic adaptor subunit [Microvirga sp. VF16]
MKRRYWILVLGTALGSAASLVPPSAIPGALQPAAPAPQYITAPVDRGDIRTTLSATGTLNAVGTVKVSSQLSGQIAEVLVDFNDRVTKGQPVARLDTTAFEARVRQAQAALDSAKARVVMAKAGIDRMAAGLLRARSAVQMAHANVEGARARAENARRDFARKQTLVERSTMSQAAGDSALVSVQSAEAALQAAEAERTGADSALLAAGADHRSAASQLAFAEALLKQQAAVLDQAEADLANSVIRAPADGEVIGKDVDRGQIVAASLSAPTLFVIAQDLRQMEVHARVDEADIGRIRPGQAAAFTVDASPGRAFAAKVAQIRKAPSLVQNVVTYTVVLSASNPDLALLPGMTALAQITIDQAKDVLRIPNAALRFRPPGTATPGAAQASEGGITAVWVLDGGRPVKVPVRTGRSNASATEIVAGSLHPEQQVIVGVAAARADGSLLSRLGGALWPRR